MTYQELKDFITTKMRMSHIYQPVMLIEILRKGGYASTEQIAKAILHHDPSQVDYYKEIVKNMVGKVLTSSRGITSKTGDTYSLIDAEKLTKAQIKELVKLCEEKIEEYDTKRAGAQWEHRKRGRKPISGSIRYKVITRARGRCEACGCSIKERNIEVDHIHPKSLGGKDDLSNYQALCYVCNAQKNNKDDTDFRNINDEYEHRQNGCLFCDKQKQKGIINENSLAFLVRDGFAVTKHHSLIIPKRHCKDYFDLTQAEINATNQLIHAERERLLKLDKTITGFNIGMNCGEDAGQTIFHCHIHLIPRRLGDVENPKGGVRGVIASKQSY
jgi:ATP adenylyltransferase